MISKGQARRLLAQCKVKPYQKYDNESWPSDGCLCTFRMVLGCASVMHGSAIGGGDWPEIEQFLVTSGGKRFGGDTLRVIWL